MKLINVSVVVALLLVCLSVGVAVAETESGSFVYSEGFVDTFSHTDANSITTNYLDFLGFYKIDYYADLQNIYIYNIENAWLHFTTEANSMQTSLLVKDGDVTIGEGTIGYGKGSTHSAIYIYFDSWDIGSLSGDASFALDYDKALFGIDHPNRWSGSGQLSEDKHLALMNFEGIANRAFPGDYRVSYVAQFQNDYSAESINEFAWLINITKVIGGVGSSGAWVISGDGGEWINESSSENESYAVFEIPIYLQCSDLYGNVFTDTLFEAPLGSLKLYGYVFDAKDVFLLNTTKVTFGSAERTTGENGYYYFCKNPGMHNLKAEKVGYQDLNNGAGVDINLSSTMRYDIPLVKSETVYSGTCTIAGVVINNATKNPIEGARVTVKNSSYDIYIYTNEMGYFVFYNLTNATYTLTSVKDGYYKTQRDVNLTTIDTAYYYPLAMVSISAAEPTPTPTPDPADEKPVVDGITTMFDLMGLGAYMGYIFAFVLIAIGGLSFGIVAHGDSLAMAIGSFFGFIVSVAIGWLPIYLIAVVICVTVFIIVKKLR
jgi:hypothetical protein